jgi:ribose transport system substrate-binding protein
VAGNNPEFGRVAGQYFKDTLKPGDIVVLRGIPTVIDSERVDNFEAAIKGSGINIIDKQFANWSRDDAFKVMQDFLSKHKKIDAVWASDDDMAIGVLEAIKQAKRDDIKLVVGGAGMKEMVKRVIDGDKLVPVNVLYPPAMIATAIQVTVAHYYGGAPVRGTYLISSPLITQENAKEYYYPDSPF